MGDVEVGLQLEGPGHVGHHQLKIVPGLEE